MSKNSIDMPCTNRCKSRHHGQALTSAITKRSIRDEALASFIKATCTNFCQAFDFEGRTALQMAASRGRTKLMEWLIRHSSEAFINARDRESGYTPLHRSIFYGQIHATVALMKIGVNLGILDKDDYKALDHATLDRHYMCKVENQPTDVYVWGSNSNYTLGTGTQQQRNTPEVLACFTRGNICIKQACLGKFHSIWVTEGGEAWCCGQAARAGGPRATLLVPTALRLPEPCLQAALTLDSTLFLLQSGTVIQYTMNSSESAGQFNLKSPSGIRPAGVRPVARLVEPRGLCASRAHAAAWTERAVYTWGANVGQLGHSPTLKTVPAPKQVAIQMNITDQPSIQLVAASDAATVITTSRGDVYLLHKYICKKIAIKQINLRQVCVDAKVSEQGVYSRVTVLLLTNVGQLMLWEDTTNKLTRCVFGLAHQIILTHVTLTHEAIYFTTKHGEAFIGYISRKTTPQQQQPIRKDKEKDSNKSALVKFLEKDDCTTVRIIKIPNIHRAMEIAVDNEGLNFSCLQIKPTCGLTFLPKLSPSSLSKDMGTLVETASEDDILHDVIFKVAKRLYPAHIYIVATSSRHLYKLYQDAQHSDPNEKPVIVIDNVLPEVFERVLTFMYTGTCDVAELGPCSLKIKKKEDWSTLKKGKENVGVEMEIDVVGNPSEISAFEVYKQQGSNKKNKAKRNTEPTTKRNAYSDPVRLVQAAAQKLQVSALHKLMEKLYYKDGMVYVRDKATFTNNTLPCWDRDSYSELIDTNVRSKDGILIPAHKCILAARLEYFHGMFMHSWTESKLLSTVTLPINHGILLPIINFLYTDSCLEIETSDSIDFLCSVLVVADQLFITRLTEMCEITLASLITLKNCAELCQFAHTYNSLQLKQCCMEFISLNIGNILESRSLDLLEQSLLEDISNYYCKFNPIMSSRVITPFFNAPDDEIVNEFAKNDPVDLTVTDEDFIKDESIVDVPKKKKQSKKIEYTESEKARMRYESVSSITSLDLSNEISGDITLSLNKLEQDKNTREKQKDKWIEVQSTQQKQLKVVQARLKAISNAKDILDETATESFTKLTKNISSTAVNTPTNYENTTPNTSHIPVSPKNLPTTEINRYSQGNLIINHVGPKLSQKQRKKLALQGNDQQPQNLNTYLDKMTASSPPDKPKNPWKICEPPVASSSPSKMIEFNQILADQKKLKDDSSRIMTKSLTLTQLEDKAIEELERFYNIHEIDDELITVRRIDLQVLSPKWIHTAPK